MTLSPITEHSDLEKSGLLVTQVVLAGRHISERAVGSVFIVFDAPVLDFLLCISQAQEPVYVQTLISKAAIERFDERIIRGFPGS